MTTVAYRDGILAADSRVTVKDVIDSDNDKKIYRLRDGSVYGMSGDYVGGLKLLSHLKFAVKQKHLVLPTPQVKGVKAILISPEKVLWYFEQGLWEKLKHPYYAVGSGGKFATAAMDAGADAITAVKIGIKRDVYSGGRVRWLEV